MSEENFTQNENTFIEKLLELIFNSTNADNTLIHRYYIELLDTGI
jgi:hypothetical protein